MTKYTKKFKSGAVAMLEGAGYPDNVYKLQEVADHLHMPSRTLRRWFNGQDGAPDKQVVKQEKRELADVFESLAYKMLIYAEEDDVIEQMSGKDAVIAAATATDKMRLLRGLPTEIVQIMPDLLEAIKKLGQEPSDVFNRIIERAANLDRRSD